jgi:hypothetical protein
MGGGDSGGSSGQPYDELGGQYASFSGGTPGMDYTALGKILSEGLNQYGNAVSASGKGNYMTNTPNMPQSGITSASPQTNVIPNSGMLGASVPYGQSGSGSMEALMRLLQGMYS